MLYIETTVLIVYTLARHVDKARYPYVEALFQRIELGEITAVTSFYALHEVFIFALKNADDPVVGQQAGKEALLEILKTKIRLVPLPPREERILRSHIFSALTDSSDLTHAICASLAGCVSIVSYDQHFDAIASILPRILPEQIALQ